MIENGEVIRSRQNRAVVELAKLNDRQEYTIVGILSIEAEKIRCGIVVE